MLAALNTRFSKAFLVREEGQAMAEYGIILALIAVIVAVAVGVLGTDISGALGKVGTALSGL
jgi:pilus assembly protein Flp/PilA